MPVLTISRGLVDRRQALNRKHAGKFVAKKKRPVVNKKPINKEYKLWRYSDEYKEWRSLQRPAQKWKCFYCTTSLMQTVTNVDHVVPRKHGGTNSYKNLVLCCKPCNKAKGNSSPTPAQIRRANRISKVHQNITVRAVG